MGDSVIRHLRFEFMLRCFMLRCFRTHHRNEHVDQRRFLSQLGQLVQWAAIFKVTVEEQAEAIAEPLRFIQSMSTDDHNFSTVPEKSQILEDPLGTNHIKSACGFIEHQCRGVMNESAGKQNPLLLSGT